MLQLLGYASDELRGRPLAMLLHESETEQRLDLGATDSSALVTFARTLQRRDGRPVRLLWSARTTPHGSLSCAVQSADALHERPHDEVARQLVDAIAEPALISVEGRITHLNAHLLAWLGYPDAAELLGLSLNALTAPAPDGAHLFRRHDQGQHRARTRRIALGAANTEMLIVREIDTQTHLQARLVQAERMASLGTLAAGIAHELNNPLTYTALNLDFVTHELTSLTRAMEPQAPAAPEHDTARRLDLRACAERAAEALRVAKAGTERASLIVRNLRTFARADDAPRAPLDVRRVLDSSISVCWNEIRNRAKLVKDFSETELVAGNEAQLGHVFLNLLMNAVQALPDGNAHGNTIRVVLRQAQERIIVEVRDTGQGIAPAIISRIFDPFFTTRPIGVSTGLGLSICHGIISRMGGEIAVESMQGKGSMFRVSLPAYKQEQQPCYPPPAAPITTCPRVLIIDDDSEESDAIARALEPEVEVLCVDSGEEALALLLSDQRFELVICDLMMRDIAGMDVFEAVKKARPGIEERFVMMTNGAFSKRARDFLKAVPNHCIEKPLDASEIRRLVHELRPKGPKGPMPA